MLWTVLATFSASFAATGLVQDALRKRAVLDHPNERSSHVSPVPRGGGLACVPVVLVAWVLVGPPSIWPVVVMAAMLAALSWIDDLRGLGAGIRLAGHVAAVSFVLFPDAGAAPVFGGLVPGAADAMLAGLVWVYFLNAFNFMDGIDGIAGVETMGISCGVAVLAGLGLLPLDFGDSGLALAGAAAGFLIWNWHPARVFLGDVGSVPLGFLTGWLLLETARAGLWAPAVILPLYYLADSGITLARRALRGERVWHAHREHFYQKAVQAGWSHARVSFHVAIASLLLVACAVVAGTGHAPIGLVGAATLVALLLFGFAAARGADRP